MSHVSSSLKHWFQFSYWLTLNWPGHDYLGTIEIFIVTYYVKSKNLHCYILYDKELLYLDRYLLNYTSSQCDMNL